MNFFNTNPGIQNTSTGSDGYTFFQPPDLSNTYTDLSYATTTNNTGVMAVKSVPAVQLIHQQQPAFHPIHQPAGLMGYNGDAFPLMRPRDENDNVGANGQNANRGLKRKEFGEDSDSETKDEYEDLTYSPNKGMQYRKKKAGFNDFKQGKGSKKAKSAMAQPQQPKVFSDDLDKMCLCTCNICGKVFLHHRMLKHIERTHKQGSKDKFTFTLLTYYRCKLCPQDMLFSFYNISQHVKRCHKMSLEEYRIKVRDAFTGDLELSLEGGEGDAFEEQDGAQPKVFTDNVAEMCLLKCNFCDKGFLLHQIRGHIVKDHEETLESHGKFKYLRKTFYKCKICDCELLFSYEPITKHCHIAHKLSLKDYKAKYKNAFSGHAPSYKPPSGIGGTRLLGEKKKRKHEYGPETEDLWQETVTGERKFFTDNINEMCLRKCRVCSQIVSSDTLKYHLQTEHKVGEATVSTSSGSDKSPYVRLTFHRCKICGKEVIFSFTSVAKHTKKWHNLNFKEYDNEHQVFNGEIDEGVPGRFEDASATPTGKKVTGGPPRKLLNRGDDTPSTWKKKKSKQTKIKEEGEVAGSNGHSYSPPTQMMNATDSPATTGWTVAQQFAGQAGVGLLSNGVSSFAAAEGGGVVARKSRAGEGAGKIGQDQMQLGLQQNNGQGGGQQQGFTTYSGYVPSQMYWQDNHHPASMVPFSSYMPNNYEVMANRSAGVAQSSATTANNSHNNIVQHRDYIKEEFYDGSQQQAQPQGQGHAPTYTLLHTAPQMQVVLGSAGAAQPGFSAAQPAAANTPSSAAAASAPSAWSVMSLTPMSSAAASMTSISGNNGVVVKEEPLSTYDDSHVAPAAQVTVSKSVGDNSPSSTAAWYDGNKISCCTCAGRFSTSSVVEFVRHMAEVHPELANGRETSNLQDVDAVMASYEGCITKTNKYYKCRVCFQSVYHEKESIRKHLLSHSMELSAYEQIFERDNSRQTSLTSL